uniref:Uncharacterized protein n=1 Tax=Arundo donax TaxID=35708 RepID=A0A0A9EN52_ARUDO
MKNSTCYLTFSLCLPINSNNPLELYPNVTHLRL